MRTVSFQKLAFEQFTDWAQQNPKLFGRLVRLISETARDPFVGIGKPEPLKGNLKGHWSRRIDEEHRLIYCVTDTTLTIADHNNIGAIAAGRCAGSAGFQPAGSATSRRQDAGAPSAQTGHRRDTSWANVIMIRYIVSCRFHYR